MHDSTIGGNGSPENIVGIGEVNNDDLVLFVDLFAYTYKVVGFESQSLHAQNQFSNQAQLNYI